MIKTLWEAAMCLLSYYCKTAIKRTLNRRNCIEKKKQFLQSPCAINIEGWVNSKKLIGSFQESYNKVCRELSHCRIESNHTRLHAAYKDCIRKLHRCFNFWLMPFPDVIGRKSINKVFFEATRFFFRITSAKFFIKIGVYCTQLIVKFNLRKVLLEGFPTSCLFLQKDSKTIFL